MKVLLIEDETELRRTIRQYLQDEGHLVESATDFPSAMEKAQLHSYDAVLVDITLPQAQRLQNQRHSARSRQNTHRGSRYDGWAWDFPSEWLLPR